MNISWVLDVNSAERVQDCTKEEYSEEYLLVSLASLAKSVPGEANVDEINLEEWTNSDSNDPELGLSLISKSCTDHYIMVIDDSDEEERGQDGRFK